MTARIIKIDPARPDDAFARCREVTSRGGVVVYPTDTVYGLGADPSNPEAVKRIFQIKGRQPDQPILLLLKDAADVPLWAEEVNPEAARLMDRYWPGPLTLVFKAREDVLPLLTAGTATIGLRVPGNNVTRRLLAFLGIALTGTSANQSGRESPRTTQQAVAAVGDLVDLILDAGDSPGGKPSTIVDVTGRHPRIIREGAVSL